MLLLRMNQLKNSSVIDLINNNKRKRVAQEETEDFKIAKATNISGELDYEERETTETLRYAEEKDKKEITKKTIKNS